MLQVLEQVESAVAVRVRQREHQHRIVYLQRRRAGLLRLLGVADGAGERGGGGAGRFSGRGGLLPTYEDRVVRVCAVQQLR